MTECQWMSANQEAYCCDRLSDGDLQRATTHIESCEYCREELREINAVDPLVKNLFRRRLAAARVPRAPRRLVPATAAVALAGGVLAIVLLLRPGASPVDTPAVSFAPPAVTSEVVPKSAAETAVTRAKPDGTAAPAALTPAAPTDGDATEAFSIIDSAGYVRRLEDFRGNVLVVGVWSADQTQVVRNLEQIYRAFARETKFRMVSVLVPRKTAPSGIAFPVVYNYDSRLLGLKDSEFVVIDRTGEERLRGSLLTDTANLNQTIQALLGQ